MRAWAEIAGRQRVLWGTAAGALLFLVALVFVLVVARAPSRPRPVPDAPPSPGALNPAPAPAGAVLVAAIQHFSPMGQVENNRRDLLRKAEEAAGLGARLVVLPETSVQGYQAADGSRVWKAPGFAGDAKEISLEGIAETVPGPSTEEFGRLAKRLRVHVVVPLVEVDPEKRLYFNTAVLIGSNGEILLHYRKAHPWTPAEYAWATPGPDEPAVVDTEIGRIGLMVCFDVHSMLSRLAEAGAGIVCTPVWWVDPDPASWFGARLPHRARTDGVAIVAANRAAAGVEGELPGAGYSAVISAKGEVLAMAEGDGPDIVIAAIDPGKTRKALKTDAHK